MKDPSRPFFKVLGTGFLVRDSTVMTNRHVIQQLQDEQANLGFPDTQKFLSFVYATAPGQLQIALSAIGFWSALSPGQVDIGFIEFQRPPNPGFQQCQPLQFGSIVNLTVGQSVAVMGYPYGTSMLTKDGRVYRFGPVLQQGHISALSPFHGAGVVNEILLDLRAAPGMSGSPVVWPGSGQVVGLVYATWEATVAVAIPVDSNSISQLFNVHDSALAQARAGQPKTPP